jgi:hypothetical protein
MAEAPLFSNILCTERYLMSVSPEAVFNWFRAVVADAKGKSRSPLSSTFEKGLMQRLLARQEPLIDLAVATYCDNAEVLEALWQSGDKTIKVAIATNTFRGGFAGLPSRDPARRPIFATAHSSKLEEVLSDPDLARALFENASIGHDAIADFLELSGESKSLSEGWLIGVYYALRNPVLKSEPEDAFADDGLIYSSKRRPFSAAWKLLISLEATDLHADILGDAYLKIAVFSPPYEELLNLEGEPNREDRLAEFSERYERGTRLYLDYVFHKWHDTKPLPDKEDDKWATSRGFIRQGAAAGAARTSYHRNVAAYLRDHPDKWVRAGYYSTFQFPDEANVRAAYEKDGAFFTEHAVDNKVLYRNDPAGRSFRAMVKQQSGEWKHYYQMLGTATRLWKENPLAYPHPEDDLDALEPPPLKREADESISDFMWRRAGEHKKQTNARLWQISSWLQGSPQEPQRVLPLIAELIASLYGEVQMCVTTLETALESTAGKPRLALAELAAELKQTKYLVIIVAVVLAIIIIYSKH